MPEELIRELCACSVHFVVDNFAKSAMPNAVDTLVVSGFMSMDNTDRHGQSIDPRKFNYGEFMLNPQLWVNHKLWMDDNGNEISVGVVDTAAPVQVSYDGMGSEASLTDMKTGAHLRTVDASKFELKNKAKGVWVECTIQEAAIIEQVEQRRLNAFSWQGLMYKNPTGTIKRIDLIEVSLVNVPANQRAVFQIGKSLVVDHSDSPELVYIDLGKVAALVHPTETKKDDRSHTGFTAMEQRLLDGVNGNVGENVAATDVTEGGEKDMDELLQKFNAVLESLNGVSKKIDGLDSRIAAVEEKAIKPAEETPAPTAAAVVEVAPAEVKVVEAPAVKAEAVAAEPEVAVAEIVAEPDPVAPVVEKESTEVPDETVANALTAVMDKLTGFDASLKKLDTLMKRVDNLEATPQEKTALDADTPTPVAPAEEAAQTDEELTTVLKDAVALLSKEDVTTIRERNVLHALIPDEAIKKHVRA